MSSRERKAVARPPGGADSDQAARDLILTALDINMLVEAGAGSGKTTSLVGRMLNLVGRGTPVDRIAAITFTRKAANELRERFQIGLEKRVADAEDPAERERFVLALEQLDRAFIGTIHSFCGRLLRERPLEAGLDPEFQEVADEDWKTLMHEFWQRWIERSSRLEDPLIAELHGVGVEPATLYNGFEQVITYPDVQFRLGKTTAPDITECRKKLEALIDKALPLLPKDEPVDGWDGLMGLVRRLAAKRHIEDWSEPAQFCSVIETLAETQLKVVQKRWSETKDGKAAAKDLGDRFAALFEKEISEVLRCWREHRYPPVMRYLLAAATEFERERIATGQLGYQDLLLRAAKLLRDNPSVRDDLGARYPHLLVDEFQDTDPIQAEVCFLLTSDSSQGNDWRKVTPRAGNLFVVGDPKQSIFRFRRADIQVYERVKERVAECGQVVTLTRNFRSVQSIERLVNTYFGQDNADGLSVFPKIANEMQAAFSPMQTVADDGPGEGVFTYVVCPSENNKDVTIAEDAEMVATWIEDQIRSGLHSAGDFLVITRIKWPIQHYARALSARNIAVSTTGAPLPQERELRELLVVLSALADPDNPVLIAAALEGLFFGCSPADLFDGHRQGIHFSASHIPSSTDTKMGQALSVLYEWWKVSQRQPADVLVERILADTGLLFLAASQELGDAGAGALLHLVEVLRQSSVKGASALTDAMEKIKVLLEADAADAPLRPGRTDAVRVMNLHKAKGLEAEVVILAAPHDESDHEPSAHVERGEEGTATGGLRICDEKLTIAQPPRWKEMAEREVAFDVAEQDRLRYVAVTRAKRKLLISQCERMLKNGPKPDCSAWSPLVPTLAVVGSKIELPMREAEGRRVADEKPNEVMARVRESAARLTEATRVSVERVTVTGSAKNKLEQVGESRDYRPRVGLGSAWGRAVHRVIEGMGRGRTGMSLERFIAAVARDEELGEKETARLAQIPDHVRGLPVWKQLIENGNAEFELTVMRSEERNGIRVLIEGVIDAVGRTDSLMSIVDWKTDDVDEASWESRVAGYESQIGAYRDMLSALSGATVTASLERVVVVETR